MHLRSLAESWATLRASPMIASLVMLVVAYSVSHRLFEFAWKGQLRTLFPSALAYQACTPHFHCFGMVLPPSHS